MACVTVDGMSGNYPSHQELREEFGEYDDPLSEFDDEYSLDEIDEDTLKVLLGMQLEANPNQRLITRTMPTGVKFSVVGEHIFLEDETDEIGHWDSAEDLLNDTRSSESFHLYYGDMEAKFNREFWEYPAPLYHGTRDIQAVLKYGIESRSESRGLNNKGVGAAVFTSSDIDIADEYGSDSDGGVVEIDHPR